jgi:hypothetical protein
VACVRVQARDPDALANVRIAYGPYARRCGVCADRTSDEARVSGRSVRSVTVALNYNLDVGTRNTVVDCRICISTTCAAAHGSQELGTRPQDLGTRGSSFYALRYSNTNEHELFFSQYKYDDFVLCTHFVPDRSRGCGVSAVACPQIHLCESTPRLRSMAA